MSAVHGKFCSDAELFVVFATPPLYLKDAAILTGMI